MATSAFKSTSRRTTSSSSSAPTKPAQSSKQNGARNLTQKAPIRRSRSVSAFSRTQFDESLDFQNKTDNPLFWVDGSPRSDGESEIKFTKFDGNSSKSIEPSPVKSSNGAQNARGRAISRNSGGVAARGERRLSVVSNGSRRDSGRSLSRVDTGRRRRSPSVGRYVNYESEKELENGFLSDARSKSRVTSKANRSVQCEKNKSFRSTSDLSEVLKEWNRWSSQHPLLDTGNDSSSLSHSRLQPWDDGGSTGSISETEEKTIIPVSEVKKTTLKNNPDITTSGILSDIVPELANHNAEQLWTDFRGDFARELLECEERTRKLRADLAVEEHREQELTKILDNIIQEPETPQAQKPLAVRKASAERKKMSKRLEEEAMAYFDECVSISTFDDSEFSSLEDPPSSTTRADVACLYGSQDLRQGHLTQCTEDSGLPSKANNSCNESLTRSNLSSSYIKPQPNPSVTISLEQDIRNYVKNISKDSKIESSNSRIAGKASQNAENCTSQVPGEEFLLDKLVFRSRIESGYMLLCGGCSGLPGAPFASIL